MEKSLLSCVCVCEWIWHKVACTVPAASELKLSIGHTDVEVKPLSIPFGWPPMLFAAVILALADANELQAEAQDTTGHDRDDSDTMPEHEISHRGALTLHRIWLKCSNNYRGALGHSGYTRVHSQFNLASKNILHNRFNNNFVIAYSCTAMSERDRKSYNRTGAAPNNTDYLQLVPRPANLPLLCPTVMKQSFAF